MSAPNWDARVEYTPGEAVTHAGVEYTAQAATIGAMPPAWPWAVYGLPTPLALTTPAGTGDPEIVVAEETGPAQVAISATSNDDGPGALIEITLADGQEAGGGLTLVIKSGDNVHVFDLSAKPEIVMAGSTGAVFDVDMLAGFVFARPAAGQTDPLFMLYENDATTPIFLVGPTMPTADPHVAGQVWNNAGSLHISAG